MYVFGNVKMSFVKERDMTKVKVENPIREAIHEIWILLYNLLLFLLSQEAERMGEWESEWMTARLCVSEKERETERLRERNMYQKRLRAWLENLRENDSSCGG